MNILEEKLKKIFENLILNLGATKEPEERLDALIQTFYHLVHELTQVELTAFRNFYARFKYLLANLDLQEMERRELDAFRRFIRRRKAGSSDPDLFLGAANIVLLLFDQVASWEAMQPLKEAVGFPRPATFLPLFPSRNYDKVKHLKLMVTEWEAVNQEPDSTYFMLTGYDVEDLEGELQVIVQKHPSVDLTYLAGLLEESMLLNFQNLSPLPQETKRFRTEYDTLITVEPDFLVDATAIGACFNNKGANSDSFFLSKLVANLPGTAALKGSLVGYYLDQMVCDPEGFDAEAVFLSGQRSNALKAAQFGRREMQKIKNEIAAEQLDYVQRLVHSQLGNSLWIEPTYFSRDHGLQGRLDLLAMPPGASAKNIVELKSGSPSNPKYSIAWENHKMQVVCYDMALDSTYGRERTGTAAVYYSKRHIDNPTPHRNIVSEQREQSRVLQIRNEVAAKLYQLAFGKFATLDRIQEHGIPFIPSYNQADLQKFRRLYQPSQIATTYYQELLAFTLRELINAKVGDLLKIEEEKLKNGFASLWLDSRFTKEKNYAILYDLELQQVDTERAHITLAITQDDLPHSFRRGDLVVFYPRTENGYYALNHHILKGSIQELQHDQLTVSLYNKQTDYSFIEARKYWAIETDLYEQNYWSTIACLLNVLSCPAEKSALLLGRRAPSFEESAAFHDPGLTENQNQVLRQALRAQDYYLLQGPPGTGKTSTFLVNFVRQTIADTGEKLMVLAFTNKAVDKICESFRKPRNGGPIPYLRFGSQYVEDQYLFRNQISGDDPDQWREVLTSHRVFVCTVATFQNRWLLLKEFINYETAVVDEASQLTEADLAGVLALFKKWILIGDHKQLPAVVTQSEKTCEVRPESLRQLGIVDLSLSLFERLHRRAVANGWDQATGQLTHHYRMHESIAALISRHYAEPLVAGLPIQKTAAACYALDDNHPLSLLTSSRIVFVETPPEVILKKNIREARIVALITEKLIDEAIVEPQKIGIITPFRAQIAEIKKHLRADLREAVIVDTVERYQGDERQIILFSTTIADARQVRTLQNISAADPDRTDRKLLVSISRAGEQLIVLGNSNALMTAADYRDMITQIIKRGGYLGRSWSEHLLKNTLIELS